MRRFVFKTEFECLMDTYNISLDIRDSIKDILFKNNSSKDRRPQYYVDPDILSADQLRKKLIKLRLDKYCLGAIQSLFKITDDLEIPSEIKNKILNNEKVAVFIGAGVSKLIDYPLWDELANSSIDYLREYNKINYFEAIKLKTEIKDPKQKLSIFDKFCSRDSLQGKSFYENKFKEKKDKKNNPYDLLVSPEFNFIKISSNIDNEFKVANDKLLSKLQNNETNISHIRKLKKTQVITKDFDINKLSKKKIYQIHGEVNNIPETIFTTEDYIKHYYHKDSNLREFLEELFSNYTVIFLGYGLEEFPILETIMKKKHMSNNHYTLVGTYLNEMNLFNIKCEYYRSLNINAIPYYLDSDGYNRLIKVLAKWEENLINERKKGFYDNTKLIDEVI